MTATRASAANQADLRSEAAIISDIPEAQADVPGANDDTSGTPSWAHVTLQDVQDARVRIMRHLHRTPLLSSTTIGEHAGMTVGLKAEVFQKTGSFKARGALNAALLLTPEQRAKGMITISAGNHGQGLAFAGSLVGTRTVVFMPKTAVPTKVDAIRGYGAEAMFSEDMEGVFEVMEAYRTEHDLTFVSPFSDRAIIAGQGVVGLEILEDMPDVENVIVPVGGGGLLAGVSLAIKSQRPDVRVVGVEPIGANIVRKSLDAGQALAADRIDTVADGLAAPFAGELSQAVIEHWVDDVILVPDDEIIAALQLILSRCKVLVEPAGAASTAGLLSGRTGAKPGSKTVVILSGGNIDPARLKTLL
jgi:threonine dehydratase